MTRDSQYTGCDKSLSKAPGIKIMQMLSTIVIVSIDSVSAANTSLSDAQNFIPERIMGIVETVYPEINDSEAAKITIFSLPSPACVPIVTPISSPIAHPARQWSVALADMRIEE